MSTYKSIPRKNIFFEEKQNKLLQVKTGERIHQQQDFITRKVKGSLSGRRQMILNGNLIYTKEWRPLEIVTTWVDTKDFLLLFKTLEKINDHDVLWSLSHKLKKK